MANIQKQFESFHETIKLNRFEENATLREKRDIVLGKLEENLPAVFEAHDEEFVEYETRDQGSYEMGTGIEPLDDDFDIDQGVYFEISRSDYPDPVVLKERVYEALDGHTNEVKIRRPCVTVWYHRDGERVYHVDLAIYADESHKIFGGSYIAMGRAHSLEENRYWEISDPQGLIDKIYRRFQGNDRAQFRRVVRYLKRWKDKNFPSDGNAAPLGVGLTVAAYRWMDNKYFDRKNQNPDDLSAMRSLVQSMLNHFSWIDSRLVVKMPVEPYNDLFEDMTDGQHEELKEKLIILRDALNDAEAAVKPRDGCKSLRKIFGADFPVPSKKEMQNEHRKSSESSSTVAKSLLGIGGVLLLIRFLSGGK